MASFHDLSLEWSMLCQDCTDCWTETDLQLAAELGKTLLERNKELENSLKQHQTVIEDQTQEIEYLSKQTVALREVNDSRLRIYEQLEVSIQDLERANLRLAQENAADKKHIKSLTSSIEALENKCEDLQSTIDDLTVQLNCLKRKAAKTPESSVRTVVRYSHEDDIHAQCSPDSSTPELDCARTESKPSQKTSTPVNNGKTDTSSQSEETEDPEQEGTGEQMTQLLSQLRESRTFLSREQRRVTELEEQLATMVQQNQSLEKQLINLHLKDEEAKSMHEEITTLEEVRQGQLCSRCLRTIDSPRTGDNLSCVGDDPEDDDSSMLEALMNHSQHRSSFAMDIQDEKMTPPTRTEPNLYRDLVEKYEALLEVQKGQSRNQKSVNSLSLQEEIQISGTFGKDTDEESGHGDSLKPEKPKKSTSHTPTDFSEAETSSSGFSDEISNKATQTEGRPGSFLCTIADGEEQFTIYDDTSPVDSRFRNRPEYHELFSEIFTVLKKAAENKDEGEPLPLLDDHDKSAPKVPPVTPATEECPDFPDNLTDDTQSVLSSAMSEVSSQMEPTVAESNEPGTKDEFILRPYKRQPLDYLSVGVNARKRSSSRRKRFTERSDSPVTPILGSPKIIYGSSRPNSGRKRKDKAADVQPNWNGSTLHFFSRHTASPTPSHKSLKNYKIDNIDYRPSTASQDLFKLKKLDLSYAEVLRNADSKKRERESAKQRRK